MPPHKGLDKPATPLALVRVSSEEQAEGWSLDEQAQRITDYLTTTLGTGPAQVVREEGVSGRPSKFTKRPQLEAALQACEAGQYSHFVVHKLDRLGRNVRLVSEVMERLDEANVPLVSVQDKIDASTASGRLFIGIFLVVAQWYSDNLSEEVKKGKAGRKRAGYYNGHLAFGCRKDDNGVPILDEKVAEGATASPATILRYAFQLAADGHYLASITRQLNAKGYRITSVKGTNPFSSTTLMKILTNRFYLGEVPLEKPRNGSRLAPITWVKGKHAQFIDDETWEKTQANLARRRMPANLGRKAMHPHAFGGAIVHCETCAQKGIDNRMHVRPKTQWTSHSSLICHARHERQGCSESVVKEDVLEEQMEQILHALALTEDARADAMDRLRTSIAADETPHIDTAAQRRKLEGRLARSRELYLEGDLSREDYLAERAHAQAELALIVDAQPDTQAVTLANWEAAGASLANVASIWHDAETAERGEMVQTIFSALWVHNHRIVAVCPRPAFWPWFAEDRLNLVEVNMRLYSGQVFHQPDEVKTEAIR